MKNATLIPFLIPLLACSGSMAQQNNSSVEAKPNVLEVQIVPSVSCNGTDGTSSTYTFSAAQLEEIHEALMIWNASLDPFVPGFFFADYVVVGHDGGAAPTTCDGTEYLCIAPMCANQKDYDGFSGFTTWDWHGTKWTPSYSISHANIVLNVACGDQFVHVPEHEIGHALGLWHTNIDTVMYYTADNDIQQNPTYEGAQDVTAYDVSQYLMLRGIPLPDGMLPPPPGPPGH